MPEFFPYWIVVIHFLNICFLMLLFRSGIEVLIDIGMGMGGWREDQQFCANAAGI